MRFEVLTFRADDHLRGSSCTLTCSMSGLASLNLVEVSSDVGLCSQIVVAGDGSSRMCSDVPMIDSGLDSVDVCEGSAARTGSVAVLVVVLIVGLEFIA